LHGGLLYSEISTKDIGTVVTKGTILGKVINPYTFEELEKFVAPYEENLIVSTRSQLSRVLPGDNVCEVADWQNVEWITH
jgi:hypothetical protein